MLVLDDSESRHGAEHIPTRAVLVDGTFEATGGACVGSGFTLGEKFGGWTMTAALKKRTPVMQLGAAANTEPAHCFEGHLAVLSGTMSQTLVTEAGVNYKLAYESFGAGLESTGFETVERAVGSAGGTGGAVASSQSASICDVVIDGTVVQTIVAASWPDAVSHETYFTAQSDETVLSFSTVGREPFTLGNVTASKVTQVVFGKRDMLGAMFSE